MSNKYVQYYVEGSDEEKFVQILKTSFKCILPGKVQVFNAATQRFTRAQLLSLKPKTTAVLLFDTDFINRIILDDNITKLSKCRSVDEILVVLQVKNLEDELLRCCEINRIEDILNSKSKGDFKRDFLKANNVDQKLRQVKFNINKLWIMEDTDTCAGIRNEGRRIKV